MNESRCDTAPAPPRLVAGRGGEEILNGGAVVVRPQIARFSRVLKILYFFNKIRFVQTSFNLFEKFSRVTIDEKVYSVI
jgi:hypothetical protein